MKLRILSLLSAVITAGVSFAGNPDRGGQASATQLVINGWARSSGMGWAAQSSIRGIESMYMNIGGLALTRKTDIIFSRTNWLQGSGININSLGIAQNLGDDNAIGLSITSIDLGDIPITTVEQPDGGLGTFSPRFTNLGIGYSKKFTERITGGVLLRVFSENASNTKMQGVAFDAGIQYKTSFRTADDTHFGVSIKNIGPDVSYSGDGISSKVLNPSNDQQVTMNQRVAKFNIPALINIGGAYDIVLDKSKETAFNKLTVAANFTYNAFSQNQLTAGLEYNYKKMFMLRAGYAYEDGIMKYSTRRTANNGLAGGVTFELPFGKNGNTFALDYSYRDSRPFSGSHAIGVKMSLGGGAE
ncbi:MAG: PorV/PorQ family protein [Flavobacteriales bacterium]|nr:PorV/PorQ family protein [Flavobacteriales bacterium]